MKLLFLKSDLAKMGSVDFDCHECLASHNILNTSKGFHPCHENFLLNTLHCLVLFGI